MRPVTCLPHCVDARVSCVSAPLYGKAHGRMRSYVCTDMQIRKERVVKDRRKAHVQQRQAEKRKSAAGGKGKPSKRSR